MLFGRRKPGYTTTVDSSVDPEQAVLDLQKAELAAKKKPKAEVFDINAASETARRLKETGSSFDGSAAKTGEDVIAAVERETAELAAKQAAEAAPEAAEAAQPDAAKPELLDFLASEPEAENDPFADQPTIMGNQQHRAAGAGESAHRLPNIVHSFGVESRAGFVEDEDVRVVHERPGDEHAPRLARG